MIETPVRQAEALEVAPARGLRGWRAVSALGAALVILAVVAVHALVQSLIPPLLIFGALAALAILLLWRGPARVGAVLGALVALALVLPDPGGIATGLSLVRDPFEFTLNVSAVVATLLLVVGGIVIAVRGRTAGAGGGAARTLLILGTLAVPVALVTSLVLRATTPEAVAQEGDVAVAISEFEFPAQLTAPAGQAGFLVSNNDPVAHTFTVPELGINANVAGGTAVRVTGDVEPGTYTYICRVSGHDFMEGTLTVES